MQKQMRRSFASASLYTMLDSGVAAARDPEEERGETEGIKCLESVCVLRLIVKCLLNYGVRGKFKQLCPWPADLFGILRYSRGAEESWNRRVEWDSPLCVLLQHTTQHTTQLCVADASYT